MKCSFSLLFHLAGVRVFVESLLTSVQRKAPWAVSAWRFLLRHDISFFATHQTAMPDLYRAQHATAIRMCIVIKAGLLISELLLVCLKQVRWDIFNDNYHFPITPPVESSKHFTRMSQCYHPHFADGEAEVQGRSVTSSVSCCRLVAFLRIEWSFLITSPVSMLLGHT